MTMISEYADSQTKSVKNKQKLFTPLKLEKVNQQLERTDSEENFDSSHLSGIFISNYGKNNIDFTTDAVKRSSFQGHKIAG